MVINQGVTMKNQLFFRRDRKHRRSPMSIAFLSLFMLSAAFFTACDQEVPLAEKRTENAEAYRFSYQGKLYEAEEFEKLFKDKVFPLMVTGTDMPDTNTIYVFDSNAAYQGWAQTTPLADKLAQVDEAAAKARNNTNMNSTSLSKGAGYGGAAILYDGIFAGTSFSGWAPSIITTLSSFNARASSVLMYNPRPLKTIISLYSRPNFQGEQFIIVNEWGDYWQYTQLPNYFWSDKTQSFILL
jgi:hypothetical protein